MHLILIVAALSLAWHLRRRWSYSKGNWAERWQRSLLLFAFPPMLLIMSSIAVFCMGPYGQMVGFWDGKLSYILAVLFLGQAAFFFLKLVWEARLFLLQIRTYPRKKIAEVPVRILTTPGLFAAIIGFWQPEFVVSSGLLQTLDRDHLEAVFAHERAHYHYRDTFWFFWLGWLRQITAWLPHTKALWEELLILRELRADAKAAGEVDSLLLAEALLLVASSGYRHFDIMCLIGAVELQHRLEERIEALLGAPQSPIKANHWFLAWWLLTLLPLLTVLFHT
ncbi:MAG TPA: M56 family metallopeptidase [Kamptonema sp.]|nr:M56 family metallopeptidase [Kamptonema sp.]